MDTFPFTIIIARYQKKGEGSQEMAKFYTYNIFVNIFCIPKPVIGP
jgi:hypothetical protein